MADGGLKLELDEALSRRLIAAAEEAGRPATDYAADLIGHALEDEWSEAERRLAEHERTGESVSIDEAMDRLEANLQRRFAEKKRLART